MRKAGMLIVATLLISSFACSTQTRELPSTKPPPDAQPVPGIGATPGVMPPAVPGGPGAEAMPAPAQELKLQEYQGQVKKTWTEGSIQFDGIVSTYSCTKASDCTQTKYYNAPSNEDECTCAAPCTPYVVNIAEKNRRESANKRFCGVDDWYGVNCPAPDCSFIEFDQFRCYKGKCAGLAMGNTR